MSFWMTILHQPKENLMTSKGEVGEIAEFH